MKVNVEVKEDETNINHSIKENEEFEYCVKSEPNGVYVETKDGSGWTMKTWYARL